jgi:hypothetical protein
MSAPNFEGNQIARWRFASPAYVAHSMGGHDHHLQQRFNCIGSQHQSIVSSPRRRASGNVAARRLTLALD